MPVLRSHRAPAQQATFGFQPCTAAIEYCLCGPVLPALDGADRPQVPAVAFAAGAGGDEPVAVAGEGEFANGRAAGGFEAGEDPAVGQ